MTSPILSESVQEASAVDAVSEPALRPKFWRHYTLSELNSAEWEALCDGCGLCCLVKLEDDDSGEVVYTKVSCMLLDTKTARCSDYAHRKSRVPDCLQLTPEAVPLFKWLPPSCAYRRIYEGKALPNWHPLITGHADSVKKAKKSVAGRCIPETEVDPEELEEYVVRWVR